VNKRLRRPVRARKWATDSRELMQLSPGLVVFAISAFWLISRLCESTGFPSNLPSFLLKGKFGRRSFLLRPLLPPRESRLLS
jgi:hypothetical protein